jgi:hypothetical protein
MPYTSQAAQATLPVARDMGDLTFRSLPDADCFLVTAADGAVPSCRGQRTFYSSRRSFPAVEPMIFKSHRVADTWRRLPAINADIQLVGGDPTCLIAAGSPRYCPR